NWTGRQRLMTCPHCGHAFPLTWARYLRSPLGTHVCPDCGTISRLNWPFSYFAFVIVSWIFFVNFAFLVISTLVAPDRRQAMGAFYFVTVYIIGCIVMIPLDRWYDERFRKLEKILPKNTSKTSKKRE